MCHHLLDRTLHPRKQLQATPISNRSLHRRKVLCLVTEHGDSAQPRVPYTTAAVPIGKRMLGRGGPEVPYLCFGCMLFGESTLYPQAERLLGACTDAGITFFDTAEMYPVPQRADTYGVSEEYLGRWLRGSGVKREDVVIASKVAGPSGQMTWIRGGPLRVDAENVTQALDGTLRRLQTDYVDLYQIHWPDRYVPMFGDSEYDPSCAYEAVVPLEEQLEALGRAVVAGKVRHVGLSNETPWGLCRALNAASHHPHLPRVVSLQNAYSLTCRTFDNGGLSEICHLEGVGLMAYSPLAMGLLTGKYLAPDGGPPDARLNRYRGRYAEAESRYGPQTNVTSAVSAYCRLAAAVGLTPLQLALRFVLSRPAVSAAVVGATNEAQLRQIVEAATPPRGWQHVPQQMPEKMSQGLGLSKGPMVKGLEEGGEGGGGAQGWAACGGVGDFGNGVEWLPAEVLAEVDAIHARYPNPTP